MKSVALAALTFAMLLPVTTSAVPRPREPRLHPSSIPAVPSYVARVESAIVGVKVRARADAASSARLGADRFASGVVFDERGYVVTVNYALMDAVRIDVTTRTGRTANATLVGMDTASGLGVIKIEADGPWTPAILGHTRDLKIGDVTGTVGVDEDNDLVWVQSGVHGLRRFSAYWEYMLDRALFVSPGSPSWGGSAVVDARGHVVGIASLRLGEAPHVNLAIPFEKFTDVKDELIAAGRVVSRRPRPWLGLYTIAVDNSVIVDGFAATGPARTAGFRRGDRIVGVNGVGVRTQEEFYEALWSGQAGDVVRLAVRRTDGVVVIPVRSIDREALNASR
ncbi:MAG: serine protease [Candidatus Rokubacteria bacterium]|nr:serine protease [Candidatus Rokubacteria bacterium]